MSDRPISHILEDNEGLAEECARLQSENEALRARVAELEEAAYWCEAENGDMQSLMALVRAVDRGCSKGWLLRKQAEAIERAVMCFGGRDFADVRLGLSEQAQLLRQQADEAEK